jgi:hypothetical protein
MRLREDFNDQVDWRLLRHMNIVFVDNFSSEDLLVMTTTMIEQHFTSQGFVNAVTRLAAVTF